MAKTFTAPFAQTLKNASAVATTAVTGLDGLTPANTVLLHEVGAEGGLLTRLSAITRANVSATSLLVWISYDNGDTKYLFDSALMAAHTIATTTAAPTTTFSRFSETSPGRLAGGARLYVGVGVNNNVVFNAAITEF
jgi:hypothetical protein